MKYTLPASDNLPAISKDCEVEVCRVMFLETFGIKKKKLVFVTKKKYESDTMAHGLTGKPSNRKVVSDDIKAKIESHLQSLPTVPSHYRRKYTKKMYFEAHMTKAKLLEEFRKKHPEVKISASAYQKIVKTYRIGFYKPSQVL